MKTIEFKILPSGDLQSIFKDDLNSIYNAIGEIQVERASDVEWESVGKSSGWTVRSHAHPQRALRLDKKRVIVSTRGPIKLFKTRETAIRAEIRNFWNLIKEK